VLVDGCEVEDDSSCTSGNCSGSSVDGTCPAIDVGTGSSSRWASVSAGVRSGCFPLSTGDVGAVDKPVLELLALTVDGEDKSGVLAASWGSLETLRELRHDERRASPEFEARLLTLLRMPLGLTRFRKLLRTDERLVEVGESEAGASSGCVELAPAAAFVSVVELWFSCSLRGFDEFCPIERSVGANVWGWVVRCYKKE